jgi:hypothetical protein
LACEWPSALRRAGSLAGHARGLMIAAAGVIVALPAAQWLGRYVSTQLFGVMPTDIVAIGGAVMLLLKRRAARRLGALGAGGAPQPDDSVETRMIGDRGSGIGSSGLRGQVTVARRAERTPTRIHLRVCVRSRRAWRF